MILLYLEITLFVNQSKLIPVLESKNRFFKNMLKKYSQKNYKELKEDYLLNCVYMRLEMIYLKLLLIRFYILIGESTDKK